MMDSTPFKPKTGADTTTLLVVTASNQTMTLPTFGTNSDGGGIAQQIRLTASGTAVIFWATGTVTASVTTSTPMLAGTVEVFSLPNGITTISVIGAATGTTLYATAGFGS